MKKAYQCLAGLPIGENAVTWMPFCWLNSTSLELLRNGCTSTLITQTMHALQ